MKISEFAKQLNKYPSKTFIFQNRDYGEGNEVLSIMVWQHLIRKDGFSKVIEHELEYITEDEFAEMARRPITFPVRPVLKIVEADPYLAQDTTINTITFEPDLDKGVAWDAISEYRIHLYYYEK